MSLPRPSRPAEETPCAEASLSSQVESFAPTAKDRITQQTATLQPSPRPDPRRHPRTHISTVLHTPEGAQQQHLNSSSPEDSPSEPPDAGRDCM